MISRKRYLTLSAIALLCLSTTVYAQTQLGADIYGEAPGDGASIVSLSSDGTRLAIGAQNNDGNGDNFGHVRVFEWSGNNWLQLGADIDGQETGASFGGALALSSGGNRLAIGARGADSNGVDAGQVRVYQWSGTDWVQLGAAINGEGAGDQSGGAISISADGDRLAIGARWNVVNDELTGHVRVYQWSGNNWVQLGSDIDGEGSEQPQFGRRVSLSSDGDRLAVGAPYSNSNGNWSGQVRVYEWSGADWIQVGDYIDGEAADDISGQAVSLSSDGTRLAIGAQNNDGNGDRSGHVRVFEWSETTWVQIGDDINGEASGDRFGSPISMSSDGTRVASGAKGVSGSGQARVFEWSGTAWTQLGIDMDGDAVADYFSQSLSLSSDGNYLAFGNDGNGDGSGSVRVFDLSMFSTFSINPGLNDAWYNPATAGQGFLIAVFPDIQQMFVAWFTYDTERPPEDVQAMLGEPGHRWLTAQGPYDGDTANLTIFNTEGGVFDAAEPVTSTDPNGDGTMTLEFADCKNGLVSYEITSLGISGEIPIERIVLDNVPLCESLGAG
ncbi:WD40 repeat domain-containing protein [Pseudomonadota bacterium]